jgi:hypothetical protein
LQFTAGRHVPGVFWFQFKWSVVKESGAWNKNRNSKSKQKKKQTNEDMRLALETTTNGERKIVWGILFLFSIFIFFYLDTLMFTAAIPMPS